MFKFFLKTIHKLDTKLCLLLMGVFSLLRVYIGVNLPIWFFSNSIHDDVLLLRYSNLPLHFQSWDITTLVKGISYPIFLFFVNFSGLSYRFWLALCWIFAGLVISIGIYKFITKNKALILLIFLFILFSPIGFDSDCALRVYRNAIIAPFTIIFLGCLFVFIGELISKIQNNKKIIIWGILLGLTFTFTFYIKEDGIMTMPIFLIPIFVVLIIKLFVEFKHKKFNLNNLVGLTKIAVLCLIPVVIFSMGTITYKEVNNHYFGLYEINTRTDGELGEFYQNLLKIDDSNKTTNVWVPLSTLEKAWNASPTLQSHPELLNDLKHSKWANGDLNKTPIEGDYIAWALRDSLDNVSLFNNETQANDLFFKVNNELDDSFENGKLDKSEKIFVTGSLPGKNVDEIIKLAPYISAGLSSCMFYNYTIIDLSPKIASTNVVEDAVSKNAELILNDNLLVVNESNINTVNFKEKIPLALANLDICVYQIISYILVPIAGLVFIFGCIYQFNAKFKDSTLNLLLGLQFLVLVTFIGQIFAIAWFSEWIPCEPYLVMKFYTVASQGFFAFFEVLAISTLIYFLQKHDFNVFSKYFKRNG